jgi:hypothetical protein
LRGCLRVKKSVAQQVGDGLDVKVTGSHEDWASKSRIVRAVDEVALHCGNSMVLLKKDGTVVIRGKAAGSEDTEAADSDDIEGITVVSQKGAIKIISKGKGSVEVKSEGGSVSVKATGGKITVSGSNVSIN